MTWRSTTLRAVADVALGRQRAPQHAAGPNMVPYLRAANVKDGVLDLDDVLEMNFTPSEQRIFSLQPGDVLMTEGSGSRSVVGSSAVWRGEISGTVCFQNTLLRLRPRSGTSDPRYLAWWAQAARASGQFASIAGGANIYHLSADRVRQLPVALPSLVEQQRIADFLDGEIQRQDRLRAAIELRFLLSAERRGSHFQDAVKNFGGPDMSSLDIRSTGQWKALPLSKVLNQLTNGYVGPTRDLLVDEGVRYLQSLHIKNGSIDFERRPYYVPRIWLEGRNRIKLRVGDLLLVQTGALGEVALVDSQFSGSGCHALLIARPDHSRVSSEYLWSAFRSFWGKSALLREQTGALHPHLEAGKVREIVVPIPPLNIQSLIVRECAEYANAAHDIEGSSKRQLALLDERRQALITAAVTGQIDVTTARGVD